MNSSICLRVKLSAAGDANGFDARGVWKNPLNSNVFQGVGKVYKFETIAKIRLVSTVGFIASL